MSRVNGEELVSDAALVLRAAAYAVAVAEQQQHDLELAHFLKVEARAILHQTRAESVFLPLFGHYSTTSEIEPR